MLFRRTWFSVTVFPDLSSMEEPLIHFFTFRWTRICEKFTGQKKLIAGSCSVATGWGSSVTIWNEHKVQLNITWNMNRPKQNKQTVGSTWRLVQYCQLPDKNSRYIMEYLELFKVFQYFYYFFHYFLQKPRLETLLYELPDDMVQDRSCKHCGNGYDAPCGCHAVPLLISPAVQDARWRWMNMCTKIESEHNV